jgi:hypothetical protein
MPSTSLSKTGEVISASSFIQLPAAAASSVLPIDRVFVGDNKINTFQSGGVKSLKLFQGIEQYILEFSCLFERLCVCPPGLWFFLLTS